MLSLTSMAANADSKVTIENLSPHTLNKTSGPWDLPTTIRPGETILYDIDHSFVIIDEEFKATYQRTDGSGGCEFISRVYTFQSGTSYLPAYESSNNDLGSAICGDYMSGKKWSEPYRYNVRFTIY